MKSASLTTALGVFVVASVSTRLLNEVGVEQAPALVLLAGLIAGGAVAILS